MRRGRDIFFGKDGRVIKEGEITPKVSFFVLEKKKK